MTAKSRVIGLTGPFGSGCSTAARHISSKAGFKNVALSKQLHEMWAKENPNAEETRRCLQDLGDTLRQCNGNDILVRNALDGIETENLVIDGIRNVGEITYLRELFGYHFTLFGIIPTNKARWDRLGAGKYSDDAEGEALFFADDHRDQDEELTYGQQVRKCIDQADILIDNSERVTLGDFKKKVFEFFDLAIGKGRAPSREEILMNMAYSACHSSQCVKRHVGAVVVDEGGNVIGIGYNENPHKTKPCRDQYKGCFKDMMKEDLLAELVRSEGRLHCPSCGTAVDISKGTKAICSKCALEGCWKTIGDMLFPERGMSFCTAIHAEAWALSAAGERARGGELFTTTYPCLQCAEKIAHSGIKTVWYTEPYPDAVSGYRLEVAGITLSQFEGVRCFDRMFANTRPN